MRATVKEGVKIALGTAQAGPDAGTLRAWSANDAHPLSGFAVRVRAPPPRGPTEAATHQDSPLRPRPRLPRQLGAPATSRCSHSLLAGVAVSVASLTTLSGQWACTARWGRLNASIEVRRDRPSSAAYHLADQISGARVPVHPGWFFLLRWLSVAVIAVAAYLLGGEY